MRRAAMFFLVPLSVLLLALLVGVFLDHAGTGPRRERRHDRPPFDAW
jgi:hypothetical protein